MQFQRLSPDTRLLEIPRDRGGLKPMPLKECFETMGWGWGVEGEGGGGGWIEPPKPFVEGV